MVGGTGAFQWGKGRRKLREKATAHSFRSRDLIDSLSSVWIKRLNPGYATIYKTHTHTEAKMQRRKSSAGTNRVTQGRRQQRSHGSLGIQGKRTVEGAKGNTLREQPP